MSAAPLLRSRLHATAATGPNIHVHIWRDGGAEGVEVGEGYSEEVPGPRKVCFDTRRQEPLPDVSQKSIDSNLYQAEQCSRRCEPHALSWVPGNGCDARPQTGQCSYQTRPVLRPIAIPRGGETREVGIYHLLTDFVVPLIPEGKGSSDRYCPPVMSVERRQ